MPQVAVGIQIGSKQGAQPTTINFLPQWLFFSNPTLPAQHAYYPITPISHLRRGAVVGDVDLYDAATGETVVMAAG